MDVPGWHPPLHDMGNVVSCILAEGSVVCDTAVSECHSATFVPSPLQSLLGVMYKIIEKDPPTLPDHYHGELRALFEM